MRHHSSIRGTVAVSLGIVGSVAMLLDTQVGADGHGPSDLVQRVVAHTTRGGVGLRSTRELRAGTASGKHLGWMTVATTLTPAGQFSWNVLNVGGSERTRDKVFQTVLSTEAAATLAGARDTAALTPENYELSALPATAGGEVRVRLRPRRSDPKLVDGVLTVSADGAPLRLEGRLAKSPSFWVNSVTVLKVYERFGGIALPTSIESLAEIKMLGRASFSMRYQYSEIDGRSVSHAGGEIPVNGPSAAILALHSATAVQN